jgi:ParB family chromosome partitioning protein
MPRADLPPHHGANPLDDPNDDADPDEAEETEQQARRVWRSWIGARYVCTDPTGHGHRDRWADSDLGTDRKKVAEMDGDERAAARAQRRDVIESNNAWTSAETVRRTWLRGLPTRKSAPKRTLPFLAAALAPTAPWSPASAATSSPPNSPAAPRLAATADRPRWSTASSRSARRGR